MIGKQIASYRIVEKLGEGGMGVVYKAVDESLDRTVAIKALSPELSRDTELVARFRTEAKAQAHLNHTNIATLYSFLAQENDCFMVMEFVEGESLDQMIHRRGPIPYDEAIPLFKQALLGIGFAHRMGIIHRDIKPGNVMVSRSGIVKVMDFGIAKVIGGRRLTRTGTQMGTVYYMSPEQIRGAVLDIRSDIYALGVMLYEMLTGHLPFEGETDFQIMSDHVNTPPPPPSRFYPYVPKGVENAVLKALEKDPNDRFQSVEEFGAALEHPEAFAAAIPPAVAAAARLRPTVIEGGAAAAPAFRPGTPPRQTPAPATPAYAAPVTPHTGVGVPQLVSETGPSFWRRGKLIGIGGGALAVLVIVSVGVLALQRSRLTGTPSAAGGSTAVPMAPSGGSVQAQLEPAQTGVPTQDKSKLNESASESETPLSPLETAGAPGKTTASVSSAPSVTPPRTQVPVPTERLRVPQRQRLSETQSYTPSPQAVEVNRLLQNAQSAYEAGKFIDPSDSSALHYARQARLLDRSKAEPEASNMENRIFQVTMNRVQAARQGHSYDDALGQVNRLIALFPEKSEPYSLKQDIVNEQQQYARELERQREEQERQSREAQLELEREHQAQERQRYEAQFKKFQVQHRHVYVVQNFQTVVYWCWGILTVTPEGLVRFDCSGTNDPQRRCDHVVFERGSINDLKGGSSLHLSAKGQGNWDFFAAPGVAQGAYEAIAPFASRKK